MRTRVWKALAKGVVLESVRRKDLWVVGILGGLIVCAAGAMGVFGLDGLEAFAKDLAVSVLSLFSTVVAVLISSRVMGEELRQRTLYPLLARPVSRLDLLLGKWLGTVLVSWIAFLVLVVMTVGALAAFGVFFDATLLQYVLAKMMGLAVLCAVSLSLSTWMTPQGAATLSLVLAIGSTMIVRGLLMASGTASPEMRGVFQAINALLPQYALFDLGSRVANLGWGPVPAWVLFALFGYAVVYSAAMLGLGWSKFRRQAL